MLEQIDYSRLNIEDMNRLSIADRAKILGMLVERETAFAHALGWPSVSLNTVTKLLVDLGQACEQIHNLLVNNVRVRRLQADEIWCFVGAKAKNVSAEKKLEGWGGCLDVDGAGCRYEALRQLSGRRT